MTLTRRTWLLGIGGAAFVSACDGTEKADIPPIPSARHPNLEDLKVGVVIGAMEPQGVRLIKVLRVDDFPMPLDYEYHMTAYDPLAPTWEEAAKLWRRKEVKIVVPHFIVRKVDFQKRDYRVLATEPLTDDEKENLARAMGK